MSALLWFFCSRKCWMMPNTVYWDGETLRGSAFKRGDVDLMWAGSLRC